MIISLLNSVFVKRMLTHIRTDVVSKHLNETSYKVRKRMGKQCSAVVKHWTMSFVHNVHLWP